MTDAAKLKAQAREIKRLRDALRGQEVVAEDGRIKIDELHAEIAELKHRRCKRGTR